MEWTDSMIDAWNKLGELVEHPELLLLPDFNKSFGIQVDSSAKGGVGAILTQQDAKGEVRAVEFFSQKWEREWQVKGDARTLELCGLVVAMKRWAHYIRNGMPIYVTSDHRSLSQTVRPLPADSPRVRGLISHLCDYNLVLDYLPGRLLLADWWSREGCE